MVVEEPGLEVGKVEVFIMFCLNEIESLWAMESRWSGVI